MKKQINFINRTWQQLQAAYGMLTARYKKVALSRFHLKNGMYTGFFLVF
jgi:hypothetical protein